MLSAVTEVVKVSPTERTSESSLKKTCVTGGHSTVTFSVSSSDPTAAEILAKPATCAATLPELSTDATKVSDELYTTRGSATTSPFDLKTEIEVAKTSPAQSVAVCRLNSMRLMAGPGAVTSEHPKDTTASVTVKTRWAMISFTSP